MQKTVEQVRKMAAITGAVLMVAMEAWAQENAPASTRRVVVSIPDRKLAVVERGHVVRVFSTAVGASVSPSPSGSYRIANRIPDPTWYTKGKVVPPGKSNPLGTRWIGLSVKGYGIHGTNAPMSIGHAASHGCIRMRNHDVEQLFEMVAVGDAVELYRERTPELEQIFGTATLVANVGTADGE